MFKILGLSEACAYLSNVSRCIDRLLLPSLLLSLAMNMLKRQWSEVIR